MTFEGFEGETWEALPGANRLTMAQREAIESDEPLLCVVAGAGAGKTRVLTLRVARRVRDGSIEADRTLVTTFSRKAAEELRTRLWSLGVSGVKAGTFHRTALGLLREHRELRGRPLPQLLPDRRRLLAEVTTGDPRRTRALDGEIGWAKARLVPPDRYEAEARRHRRRSGVSTEQVADAYARYEAERTRRRLLDFDDLIVACADALAGDREFADSIRWRTRHLFVDEMQDVNPAQFRLLTRCSPTSPTSSSWATPTSPSTGSTAPTPPCSTGSPRSCAGTEGHPPRREPPLHAPGGGGGDRGAARRRSHCSGAEVVAPAYDPGRRAGPRGRVARHRRRRGRVGGGTGPRCRAPRVAAGRASRCSTRTNAQLTKVQAAMDAARVPSTVAGSDLGPASRPARRRHPAGRRDRRGGDRGTRATATAWCSPPSTAPRASSGPPSSSSACGAGLMPMASAQTPAAIDEERRLLYVALTRSEEELWCSWSERSGDAAEGAAAWGPSPWLAPIERAIATLEKEAAPTAAAEISARVAELRRRLAEASDEPDDR